MPCTDDTLTTRPQPWAYIPGSAPRTSRNGASSMIRRMRENWSGGNCSMGETCWIPAQLTRTSAVGSNAATASRSERSSTSAVPPVRAATSSMAARVTSTARTWAPARARRRAVARPMPLPAPVTSAVRPVRSTATLSTWVSARVAFWDAAGVVDTVLLLRCGVSGREVVMDQLGAGERQVGQDVAGADDLEHGEVGERREGVLEQLQPGRAGPGTAHGEVGDLRTDELGDAWSAVVARDELEHERRDADLGPSRLEVHRRVLETHRRRGHPEAAVVEGAHERVGVDRQARAAELLGIGAAFAAQCDGRCVVEVHRVDVLGRPSFV